MCASTKTFHFILYFDGTSAEEQIIRHDKKSPEGTVLCPKRHSRTQVSRSDYYAASLWC